MKAFYRDFELMKNEKFDGMIITGAPVEHLDFEDVNYWDEIMSQFWKLSPDTKSPIRRAS